ncbi:MAG TPA: glycosyltransferase family 4 protein [Candidatus Deferrimicrobiaceae bacterium]|nr:glycosyltransferase family 4 protein [Candidatus Deferrimicrobiaceae bacterium]
MTPGRPLTVLHLVANRWWTGSAEPVIRLLTGLRARGHRVLLGLIAGDRFEQKAREAGLEPLAGLSLEVRGSPLHALADLWRLRRVMRAEGVDVIHVHHSHDHWLGWLARAGGRAALVRTFHNARAVRLRWPSTALYRRTDALIAVSREIEERGRRAGIPTERLTRVEGVVDLDRFESGDGGAAIRKEFDLTGAPVLGCVARLAPRRGHELLIRGFRLLLAEHPRARLLLVGKGEARARLEALVAELGLAREVLFTGYRDADLPGVLQALDVFALMGAGSDESCRAALEAMAAGRAVVGRRVGALPETVVHGVTGLLVDDDRPESVAAALRALVAEPERAAAMGRAGRERARARYGSDAHAARVEGVYERALRWRAGETPA